MKLLTWSPLFCLFCLLLVCCYLLFPHASRALKPLDDQALLEYSPSTIEKLEKMDIQKQLQFKSSPFSESICFKKCHQSNDFSPADKTRRQWQLLIGENGHAVFKKIPWKNSRQKKHILQYLLKHAQNASTGPEGIGVWH